MIHGILIDLDDTLSDDKAATEQAIIALCATRLLFIDETPSAVAARWIDITDRCWRRYLDGELSLQGQRRERIRQFIGHDLADAETDLLFGEYLLVYEASWKLAPGADYFLAQTAGIPIALVSNGDARQVGRKVAALGLQDRLAAIVTPEDAGAAKPLPQMFTHALRALGLPAEQCIMVGDSMRNDIEPAQRIGMRAFHIDLAHGRGLREAADAIARAASHTQQPETARIIDQALAWAQAQLGRADYAGRCLGFIEDCFERGNSIEVFGYSSAQEAADAYGAQPGDGPAPRGALVFYACQGLVDGDLRRWGHVGIALGDGRVLHAWDVVRIDREREIELLAPPPTWSSPVYIGWAPAERMLAGCIPRQWEAS